MQALRTLVTATLVASAATGCSQPTEKEDASSLSHLTAAMPACYESAERADALYRDLAPVTSGDPRLVTYLLRQISSLPAFYTDYLVRRARQGLFRIEVGAGLGAGIAGLATGGFDGTEPTLIQFPADYELVRQAALHEFGHALHAFTFRQAGLGPHEAAMTEQARAAAVASRDTQAMWSYPKTNRYEYWASAFSHYYCSKAARDEMRAHFPSSYAFLDSVAGKAERAAKPVDPRGDDDGDGVANADDFCADTPAGAVVHKRGMYRGCAPTQRNVIAAPGAANGDDDGDGVANGNDWCPATPRGAVVERQGDRKGCAAGETKADLEALRLGN